MSTPPPPLVYAHRGASADHPENTIAAFHGALEQGADRVELDVRLTSDRGLVVHHDPMYPDGRVVWDTPVDQRPAHAVDLDAALDACAGMGVNVEIKNSHGDLGGDHVPHDLTVVDLVLEVLARRRDEGRDGYVEISSFDVVTLERVRELDPDVPTAQLGFDQFADPAVLSRLADIGHVAVNPWDPFVDPALIERCGALGLGVNAWTVDDEERIRQLASLGVSGIITNRPAAARAALRFVTGG